MYLIITYSYVRARVACTVAPGRGGWGGGGGGGGGGGAKICEYPLPQPINSHHATDRKELISTVATPVMKMDCNLKLLLRHVRSSSYY